MNEWKIQSETGLKLQLLVIIILLHLFFLFCLVFIVLLHLFFVVAVSVVLTNQSFVFWSETALKAAELRMRMMKNSWTTCFSASESKTFRRGAQTLSVNSPGQVWRCQDEDEDEDEESFCPTLRLRLCICVSSKRSHTRIIGFYASGPASTD